MQTFKIVNSNFSILLKNSHCFIASYPNIVIFGKVDDNVFSLEKSVCFKLSEIKTFLDIVKKIVKSLSVKNTLPVKFLSSENYDYFMHLKTFNDSDETLFIVSIKHNSNTYEIILSAADFNKLVFYIVKCSLLSLCPNELQFEFLNKLVQQKKEIVLEALEEKSITSFRLQNNLINNEILKLTFLEYGDLILDLIDLFAMYYSP